MRESCLLYLQGELIAVGIVYELCSLDVCRSFTHGHYLSLPIYLLSSTFSRCQEEKMKGVIAASAGNHALALAYHGHQMDIPVVVVMPEVAPLMKVREGREGKREGGREGGN